MRIICGRCASEAEVFYWQWGMEQACPSCHRLIHLEGDAILSLGVHQWDVSYRDFILLVTNLEYQKEVWPLLRAWLNFEVVQAGSHIRFLDARGGYRHAEQVHAQIQRNEVWQYAFYQAAIALWNGNETQY